MIYLIIYLIGVFLAYGIGFGSDYSITPDKYKKDFYKDDLYLALQLCWLSWLIVIIYLLVYRKDLKFKLW